MEMVKKTVKISANRNSWKEIKRLYMSVKHKDLCHSLQLEEGDGFFRKEFLLSGYRDEVEHCVDIMKLILKKENNHV